MSYRILKAIAAFRRDESGSSQTIAFAIWLPMIIVTLLTALEVGAYTARATMLERALDLVVRDIRLGTGSAPQHDAIKTAICDRAAILPNCESNLRLEMLQRDPRSWTGLPATADCTDASLPVAPVRGFENGQNNELMVLRACAKVSPIFPITWMAEAVQTDGAGDFALMAATSFVQEPR